MKKNETLIRKTQKEEIITWRNRRELQETQRRTVQETQRRTVQETVQETQRRTVQETQRKKKSSET